MRSRSLLATESRQSSLRLLTTTITQQLLSLLHQKGPAVTALAYLTGRGSSVLTTRDGGTTVKNAIVFLCCFNLSESSRPSAADARKKRAAALEQRIQNRTRIG